jgi:hypothetical protein
MLLHQDITMFRTSQLRKQKAYWKCCNKLLQNITNHRLTRRHNPEDFILQKHRLETSNNAENISETFTDVNMRKLTLWISLIYFCSWLDSPSVPRPPHCWGFEITLTHTTLLWTSDRPVAVTSTWQHTPFTMNVEGITSHTAFQIHGSSSQHQCYQVVWWRTLRSVKMCICEL